MTIRFIFSCWVTNFNWCCSIRDHQEGRTIFSCETFDGNWFSQRFNWITIVKATKRKRLKISFCARRDQSLFCLFERFEHRRSRRKCLMWFLRTSTAQQIDFANRISISAFLVPLLLAFDGCHRGVCQTETDEVVLADGEFQSPTLLTARREDDANSSGLWVGGIRFRDIVSESSSLERELLSSTSLLSSIITNKIVREFSNFPRWVSS